MVPCSLLQLKIAREEVFLEQQKSALSRTATGMRGAKIIAPTISSFLRSLRPRKDLERTT